MGLDIALVAEDGVGVLDSDKTDVRAFGQKPLGRQLCAVRVGARHDIVAQAVVQLQKGALCSFAIIVVSGALYVALRATGLQEMNPLL